MINTTTTQPYDPWEILENAIKHREQTNMSIKALCLWNPGKLKTIRMLAVLEKCFVTTHWSGSRTGIFINVFGFYLISLVLFIEKVLLFHCFLCNRAFFLYQAWSIIYYSPVCSLSLISTESSSRAKQDGENSHSRHMTYHRDSQHEHLTHWINKIIKLHKSPRHSTRVPTVFHLVCLAARGPHSCWEISWGESQLSSCASVGRHVRPAQRHWLRDASKSQVCLSDH